MPPENVRPRLVGAGKKQEGRPYDGLGSQLGSLSTWDAFGWIQISMLSSGLAISSGERLLILYRSAVASFDPGGLWSIQQTIDTRLTRYPGRSVKAERKQLYDSLSVFGHRLDHAIDGNSGVQPGLRVYRG